MIPDGSRVHAASGSRVQPASRPTPVRSPTRIDCDRPHPALPVILPCSRAARTGLRHFRSTGRSLPTACQPIGPLVDGIPGKVSRANWANGRVRTSTARRKARLRRSVAASWNGNWREGAARICDLFGTSPADMRPVLWVPEPEGQLWRRTIPGTRALGPACARGNAGWQTGCGLIARGNQADPGGGRNQCFSGSWAPIAGGSEDRRGAQPAGGGGQVPPSAGGRQAPRWL